VKEYTTIRVPATTEKKLTQLRCDMCTVTVNDRDKYYVVDSLMGSSGYQGTMSVVIFLCAECLNKLQRDNA